MFKCFFHCYCRWCQRLGRLYLVQTPEEHSSTDVPNFLTTNFVSFIQIFLSYPKTIWLPTDKKNVCKLLSGWTFLWIYLEGVIFVLFCFVFLFFVFFLLACAGCQCWYCFVLLWFAFFCFPGSVLVRIILKGRGGKAERAFPCPVIK